MKNTYVKPTFDIRPPAITALLLLLLSSLALAEKGDMASVEVKAWILASSGDEISEDAAQKLIAAGEHKMIKTAFDGSGGKALLYREIEELEGHLPAGLLEMMRQPNTAFDQKSNERIGKPYGSFTFTDLEGNEVRSTDLLGKVVVLNYWFISCKPCVVEMPMLNDLAAAYSEREVVFLAVTWDAPDKVRKFLTKNPFDYRQTHATEESLSELGVSSYPTHVVLDRTGTVNGYLTGLQTGTHGGTHSQLVELIDQALAETKKNAG